MPNIIISPFLTTAAVIKVDGVCYQFVGVTPAMPTLLNAPDEEFEDCETCEGGSGSGSGCCNAGPLTILSATIGAITGCVACDVPAAWDGYDGWLVDNNTTCEVASRYDTPHENWHTDVPPCSATIVGTVPVPVCGGNYWTDFTYINLDELGPGTHVIPVIFNVFLDTGVYPFAACGTMEVEFTVQISPP